jgi:hypothetical protein
MVRATSASYPGNRLLDQLAVLAAAGHGRHGRLGAAGGHDRLPIEVGHGRFLALGTDPDGLGQRDGGCPADGADLDVIGWDAGPDHPTVDIYRSNLGRVLQALQEETSGEDPGRGV